MVGKDGVKSTGRETRWNEEKGQTSLPVRRMKKEMVNKTTQKKQRC